MQFGRSRDLATKSTLSSAPTDAVSTMGVRWARLRCCGRGRVRKAQAGLKEAHGSPGRHRKAQRGPGCSCRPKETQGDPPNLLTVLIFRALWKLKPKKERNGSCQSLSELISGEAAARGHMSHICVPAVLGLLCMYTRKYLWHVSLATAGCALGWPTRSKHAGKQTCTGKQAGMPGRQAHRQASSQQAAS